MRVVDPERLGRQQPVEIRNSVRGACEKKVAARETSLAENILDPASLRDLAGRLRQHVLDHLDEYLDRAEKRLESNGVQVHWAKDAAQAREVIAGICRTAGARLIVKGKSMVSEEIELNHHLEAGGFEVVETDLGEFVVQLDADRPSHIVTPIIHKSKEQIAQLFERKGLGEHTQDPEALTMQARRHLRRIFEQADVGITGVNFVVAESGRIVTVSNEGNVRFCSTLPRVHIALTGVEKIVAREDDLAALLKMLARSSTGQDLTVYTQFLGAVRSKEDPDGSQERHLIFLDNGRTEILGGRYREMLRCIRCGACLNVCPVYRTVTGHSYGSVYPGPMGAILSPLLGSSESRWNYAALPKASSLCAACEEVCPVAIPIPKMLLSLRQEIGRGAPLSGSVPNFGLWALLVASPRLWRWSLRVANWTGWRIVKLLPVGALRAWLQARELPEWPRESFREAWRKRKR
ncbi:MAG: LutB/LldF family L-lactate oxidation iron-sulfur protein [bacterium]